MNENNTEPEMGLNPRNGFSAIFLSSSSMLLFAYFAEEKSSPFLFETFCVFIPAFLVLLFKRCFRNIFFPLFVEKKKIKFSLFFFFFSFITGFSTANIMAKIFDISEIINEYEKTILQYNIIYQIVLFAVFPALFEEILFRGVILKSFSKYGKSFSFLLTSILFAVFHGSYELFLPIYIMSAFLTIVGLFRGGLFLAIFFHFLFNFLNLIAMNYLQNELDIWITSAMFFVSAPFYLFLFFKGLKDA